MRSILIAASCLLVATTSLCQKENQSITSKIDKVTMFLQGAQVERTARQALPIGKYNLVFNSISPRIDKQSIQLKADGRLTVLSVTHQLNHLEEQTVQEGIRQLDSQKDQLLQKLALEKNIRNVYVQEEQMIIKNQSIKGDATLKAADLKEAADFQRQRLTEIYQKLQETDRTIRKLESDVSKLGRQLTELNQKKDLSTSDVIVAVDVKEAMTAGFRLSYIVTQASWHPSYDVRVQDISKPLNLQIKANVNQQSGEDWKDVKLFLSTGNPGENGTKPTLLPWHLRYYYPQLPATIRIRGTASLEGKVAGLSISNTVTGSVRDSKGMPIAGVSVMVKGTSTGAATDANGNYTVTLPTGFNTLTASAVGFQSQEINVSGRYANIVLNESANMLEEVVVVGYGTTNNDNYEYFSPAKRREKKEETAVNTTTTYQPTTTIFEIEDPYTVPNDGKLYTVDINKYELKALYEYYTAPKPDPSAYLTAKVTDWQELNLLPGEANLFFEGTYLGNSILDVQNAGDTLNISLGRDKSVVVKRTLMKENSSKKFLGSNKTDSRQYEIVVRNNKPEPISIIVEDQFPLSTDKDIEVEKLSYAGGRLDDDTKKVTWNLAIEGRKEVKLQMGFSVKYPKEKVVLID